MYKDNMSESHKMYGYIVTIVLKLAAGAMLTTSIVNIGGWWWAALVWSAFAYMPDSWKKQL